MKNIDGESYRKLREAAGLSRKELATAAGVSYSVVSSLERGARPRGGDAVIEKVDTELRRETGVRVDAERSTREPLFLQPGDVVTVTLREDLLMKVLRVDDEHSVVHGVEMLTGTSDSISKATRLGAQVHRHNGRTYLLRNLRCVDKTKVTRHWTNETPTTTATMKEVDDNDDE